MLAAERARTTRSSARRRAPRAPARAAGSSTRSTARGTTRGASRSGRRSIALEADGSVQVGVVSAPALRSRWWAERGAGRVRERRAAPRLGDRAASRTPCSRSRSSTTVPGLARRAWHARGLGDFWAHMLVAEGAVDGAVDAARRERSGPRRRAGDRRGGAAGASRTRPGSRASTRAAPSPRTACSTTSSWPRSRLRRSPHPAYVSTPDAAHDAALLACESDSSFREAGHGRLSGIDQPVPNGPTRRLAPASSGVGVMVLALFLGIAVAVLVIVAVVLIKTADEARDEVKAASTAVPERTITRHTPRARSACRSRASRARRPRTPRSSRGARGDATPRCRRSRRATSSRCT